jgi:hypothetical protein
MNVISCVGISRLLLFLKRGAKDKYTKKGKFFRPFVLERDVKIERISKQSPQAVMLTYRQGRCRMGIIS